jgi:molybdate transport system regulatory protein
MACVAERGFGMMPAMAETDNPRSSAPSLRIRILFGDEAMLGPGKADLLERIRDTGSIAAAGRSMDMSYKRAWMLVETMNAAFRDPLVDSTRGGTKGGGARLTEAGATVLANYRKLEEILAKAGAARIGAIRSMLRDIPEEK